MNVELRIDILNMPANSGDRHPELRRDLFIGVSFGDELDHFQFAVRQLSFGQPIPCRFTKSLDDAARNLAGHWRAALHNANNRMDDFFRRVALKQVTAGTCLKRFEDVIVVRINREHQDLRFGQVILQQSGAFKASHAGQIDIHQHDVGRERGQAFERLLAGFARGDATKTWMAFNDLGQTFAQLTVIFDDADFDFVSWFRTQNGVWPSLAIREGTFYP